MKSNEQVEYGWLLQAWMIFLILTTSMHDINQTNDMNEMKTMDNEWMNWMNELIDWLNEWMHERMNVLNAHSEMKWKRTWMQSMHDCMTDNDWH